ncbi:MAG: hypothetical protein WCP24_01095 [bacterium]
MSFLRNKKFIASVASFFLLFVFIMPILSHAALINCGDNITVVKSPTGSTTITGMCTFDDLIKLINNIINWIISIAGVIFTISCIYGGFLYITSGSNPGNKAKAKSILYSTLIGFVIILVAWLIVYTLLRTLAPDNKSILQFISGGK